ncbi:unnamed protein product [Mytilus coruscus]|uniref:Ig-like domain-containing protein n=1 Tax=Mytilus coruscus TaxID=42192 RepID=A0A6J7ZS37_MYTCO|nr:unnamed protein product [Mytilus coruscus]
MFQQSESFENIVYVRANSTVHLDCPILPAQDALIWRGPPNSMIYGINGKLNGILKKQNRISTTQNPETKKYKLTIKTFSEEDEGHFQCDTVMNGKTLKDESTVVLAESPSGIYLKSTNGTGILVCDEGLTVEVHCTINEGKPNATLTILYREDVVAVRNSSHLSYSFIPTKADNNQWFTCVADNGLYEIETAMNLSVHASSDFVVSPEVKIIADPSSNVEENTNVSFHCTIETNTFPTSLVWKFRRNIIKEVLSDELHLPNVQRYHYGVYSCEVQNRIGTGEDSLSLIIRYKPSVAEKYTDYKLEAELGNPTKIRMVVNSFPEPEVSWILSAGGKLGYWIVKTNGDRSYSIKTTILPKEESHIGKYKIRIRNDVGSTDVIINLVSRIVTIKPFGGVCNSTEEVKLMCVNKAEYLQAGWSVAWVHKLNGIFMRSPFTTRQGNLSTLEIHFCDYTDTGAYSCKWTKGKIVYEYTVKLIVHEPTEVLVAWLFNGKIIQHPNTLPISRQYVNLTIYKKFVSVEGFKASLLLNFVSGTSSGLYTCLIRNSFGITETLFKDSQINNAIDNLKLKLITNDTISTKSDGNSIEGKYSNGYAYGVAGALAVLLLIAIIVVLINQVRLMWRVSQDNNATFNVSSQQIVTTAPTHQEEESLQPISIYEEIQSIHSQVNDTENTSGHVDTSGSETSSERPYLELESPNTYEDLEKPEIEMELYKTC